MIIDLEIEDLVDIFGETYVARGINYEKKGMVYDSHIIEENDGSQIVATVRGSGTYVYQTTIFINHEQSLVSGNCSCPIGFNCKHVIAVLVKHINQQSVIEVNNSQIDQKTVPLHRDFIVDNWLRRLKDRAQEEPKKKVTDELRFILFTDSDGSSGRYLAVKVVRTRRLKNGGWGKQYPKKPGSESMAAYLTEEDHRLLGLLNASLSGIYYSSDYKLTHLLSPYILELLIESKKLHWDSLENPEIVHTEQIKASLDWQLKDEAMEVVIVEHPEFRLLPFKPLMYFDLATNSIGQLITDLSDEVENALSTAPAIPAEYSSIVKQELEQTFPKSNIVLPDVKIRETVSNILPIPILTLFSIEENVYYLSMGAEYDDYADLHFDYDGLTVSPHAPDPILTRTKDAAIEKIQRNEDLELEFINALLALDLSIEDIGEQPQEALRFYHVNEDDGWMRFSINNIEPLRKSGWKINIDSSFRFNAVDPDEWYADLDDSKSEDWFSLELGVKIDDEKLSLLPIVVNFIQQQTQAKTLEQFLELDDDYPLFLSLEDGRKLHVTLGEIRPIIETLVELYDPDALNVDGKLTLSRHQAGQLNSLGDDNLKWEGAKAPRLFAEKLSTFKQINEVSVPSTLKAELRPYQQQGLNWLQFLREYDLAGILADEMGLGKTIQTLAHILKEKESGRMTSPCLVVATTSLMVNWANEVKQFAPSLSVLVSQGDDRKQHFDSFSQYDIVLTTYPLLPRDNDVLLEQEWYLLILDEAQYIKNPRSKVAETARQLKAKHRLCLTGTPMENHLGELWSQFHFLMPGLLGNEKQFRQLFRKPIEDKADQARQQQLNKRLAPFLLRREKSLVAKELPEKTDIISSVELSGQQRQLYETIRVAMNDKVRKEIDKKGIARSQIIILDALLKLRQVCCDPRLLKLDAAKKVKNSAKLEQLMDMLPEMIVEGRRILLFSQFTSMLSLIEKELEKRKINYVKLTGQTKDRATPINQFQDEKVPLFLISLKAGGAGLNLTAADTVIHYDPWWNPAVEAQATDRAHRIGQKNKVFVYKFITSGTVEEKINAMQKRKKALADALFGKAKKTEGLTEHDIQALFEPLE